MRRTTRLGLAAFATVAVLAAAAPVAAYLQPQLAGADRSLVVLTGSMQPALDPGDVVLVETDVRIDEIHEGDVITFQRHPGAGETVTHRVVEVTHDDRGTVLTTKGDANEDPDPMAVGEQMLVGRVDRTIPHLGHVVAAAQGPIAPLALVVLSILTVGHEVRRLIALGEPERRFPVVEHPRRFEVVRRR